MRESGDIGRSEGREGGEARRKRQHITRDVCGGQASTPLRLLQACTVPARDQGLAHAGGWRRKCGESQTQAGLVRGHRFLLIARPGNSRQTPPPLPSSTFWGARHGKRQHTVIAGWPASSLQPPASHASWQPPAVELSTNRRRGLVVLAAHTPPITAASSPSYRH